MKYKIAPISGKRAPSRIRVVNTKTATVGVFRRTRRGLSRRRAVAADISLWRNEIGGASFAFYGKFYKRGADSRASFTSGRNEHRFNGRHIMERRKAKGR